MNKVIALVFTVITSSMVITSCTKSRGNNTGIEYAPDMYYDKGYEPYKELEDNKFNKYGSNMREPVKGTVAIGKLDYQYHLDNTGEGYEASATEVNFPEGYEFDFAKGKRLYGIYCAVCHGFDGKNDGSVFKRVSNIKPAWPNYQDEYIRTLPVGKIYHVLVYGKNNMGSHASVLTPEERWHVVSYVKVLAGTSNDDNATTNQNKNTTEEESITETE